MDLVPGVEELFQKLFLSYEMKLLKPDEDYFHHIVEDLKIDPSHCVFIDDMGPNIRAAQNVGISAIQFESADQLRKSMRFEG